MPPRPCIRSPAKASIWVCATPSSWRALIKAEPNALRNRSFAERFHNQRRLDRGGSILLTDGLVRVFSNAFPGLSWLRGCGLTALDCLPPAKRVFMGRMLFGA